MAVDDFAFVGKFLLKGGNIDTGTVLLIVIGAILVIALVALLGSGMAMGGMAMMAGMMSTPVGWVVLLILVALIGYTILYPG